MVSSTAFSGAASSTPPSESSTILTAALKRSVEKTSPLMSPNIMAPVTSGCFGLILASSASARSAAAE